MTESRAPTDEEGPGSSGAGPGRARGLGRRRHSVEDSVTALMRDFVCGLAHIFGVVRVLAARLLVGQELRVAVLKRTPQHVVHVNEEGVGAVPGVGRREL